MTQSHFYKPNYTHDFELPGLYLGCTCLYQAKMSSCSLCSRGSQNYEKRCRCPKFLKSLDIKALQVQQQIMPISLDPSLLRQFESCCFCIAPNLWDGRGRGPKQKQQKTHHPNKRHHHHLKISGYLNF